jgi:hypothetical protein
MDVMRFANTTKMVATQSTTYSNSVASLGMDDNESTFQHTAGGGGEKNPWFQIVLSSSTHVSSVEVRGRTGGCANRLFYGNSNDVCESSNPSGNYNDETSQGATIRVSNSPCSGDNCPGTICGRITQSNSAQAYTITCPTGTTGQYVIILLPGNNRMLGIKEMDIFEITNPPEPTPSPTDSPTFAAVDCAYSETPCTCTPGCGSTCTCTDNIAITTPAAHGGQACPSAATRMYTGDACTPTVSPTWSVGSLRDNSDTSASPLKLAHDQYKINTTASFAAAEPLYKTTVLAFTKTLSANSFLTKGAKKRYNLLLDHDSLKPTAEQALAGKTPYAKSELTGHHGKKVS